MGGFLKYLLIEKRNQPFSSDRQKRNLPKSPVLTFWEILFWRRSWLMELDNAKSGIDCETELDMRKAESLV